MQSSSKIAARSTRPRATSVLCLFAACAMICLQALSAEFASWCGMRSSTVQLAQPRRVAMKATETELREVIPVKDASDFQDKIANGVVVAMFSSPFCGPCLLMEPKVVEISDKYSEVGVKIFKVNLVPGKSAADIKALFGSLGVRELPTFVVYKDGEEQGRVTGTRSQELEELIAAGVA
mmetsp:Transcript_61749/g.133795  ORF Transcript_61749/g.133795 Transcript_61749/m.133795 type:complete len:179 (-) Transcript_61749:105-641(-)